MCKKTKLVSLSNRLMSDEIVALRKAVSSIVYEIEDIYSEEEVTKDEEINLDAKNERNRKQ